MTRKFVIGLNYKISLYDTYQTKGIFSHLFTKNFKDASFHLLSTLHNLPKIIDFP